MHYKITTVFLEPALHIQDLYIELHGLARMERKMTCHQNPGPGDETLQQHSLPQALGLLTSSISISLNVPLI